MEKTDNELIAEFMNVKATSYVNMSGATAWKIVTDNYFTKDWGSEKSALEKYYREARYHASWDWLMPVVEKIGKMYDSDYEDGKYYHVDFAHTLMTLWINSQIDEVYREVIKSIKWYNSQRPDGG